MWGFVTSRPRNGLPGPLALPMAAANPDWHLKSAEVWTLALFSRGGTWLPGCPEQIKPLLVPAAARGAAAAAGEQPDLPDEGSSSSSSLRPTP